MHQELMDIAYEKFEEHLSHEEWMYKLSDIEKKAVVLGNLNYQVENGGFYQWVDNGYVSSIEYLLLVLKEMNTETSKRLQNFLRIFAHSLSLA